VYAPAAVTARQTTVCLCAVATARVTREQTRVCVTMGRASMWAGTGEACVRREAALDTTRSAVDTDSVYRGHVAVTQ